MVPEKKRKKQCQQLSFKWSQSNVSAIDLLKLYSKLIQHRITFVYASVCVKCPQKPKFEKNWLSKIDLTLGEKGLKFVIVRQKRQYLGLVFVSDEVDGEQLRSWEAVEILQMVA